MARRRRRRLPSDPRVTRACASLVARPVCGSHSVAGFASPLCDDDGATKADGVVPVEYLEKLVQLLVAKPAVGQQLDGYLGINRERQESLVAASSLPLPQ